jgi:predicted nucleic acid-binding protein
MSRIFLDTNVLLYTLDDEKRALRARRALLDGYAISVQVLNEFASVVRRKQILRDEEIWEVESRFRQLLVVMPLTIELHEAGLRLSTRYGFHFYDSLIVAAALETECDVLYSEDLQHNQRIEGGLRVVNPFR